MKLRKTQVVSLRIIVLFTVAIFSTFLTDNLHSFFGDHYCTIPNHRGDIGIHTEPEWHWGYRHTLYFIMSTTLFAIQLIDIRDWVVTTED
jgi:hypothetical protein